MKNGIFKAYDIRGKYEKEIGKKETQEIARAFLGFLTSKKVGKKIKVVIARDGSFSSKKLFSVLKEEFFLAGCEVIDLEEATTPMWNWFTGKEKADGGIIVTASHLTDNYAGFKMAEREARPVLPEKITPFFEVLKSGAFLKGEVIKVEKKKYFGFLKKEIKVKRKMKVVVDTCGGGAGEVIREVFKGNKNVVIKKVCFSKCEHKDNPLEEKNWQELRKKMFLKKFDCGVMFDGDGDRVVFFDEEKNFIQPDLILAMLANKEIKRGNKFVGDLNLSRAVKEMVERQDGEFVESKVGHVFIKEKMIGNEAVLGGESSGHIYFKEMFYAEGAILAFIKVLNILSEEKERISKMLLPFQRYWKMKERNFAMAGGKFKMILEMMEKKFEDGKISKIDGIKIEYPEWWFSVRRSNTEEKVRVNFEAREEKFGRKKFREVLELLKDFLKRKK